eukprot:TRINITY_DN10926_c0_g2_i5.p2 TRINITY_DN10926_c0_g2~~TRINITY_DN10926_c0_g2_i5.p2  ORF type:complete len:243 (+),score=26.47 TRINITY_DN10926_c0_g2_i5:693-1421(+)
MAKQVRQRSSKQTRMILHIGKEEKRALCSLQQTVHECSKLIGHAARPHLCADATVAAAAIVTALQTLVSREVDPADAAVVTIGKLTSGTAYNVIAETAVMDGTLRCIQADTRARLKTRLISLVQSVAAAHNTSASIVYRDSVPPVINSSSLIPIALAAAREIVANDAVIPLPRANMGAEDFGNYLEHVSGVFVRYGAGMEDASVGPAHSSTWDFDESALLMGAQFLSGVVQKAMQLSGPDRD